jgi:hypothetical protein
MKWNILWAAAITAMLAACVTINIYFPAAAAEKAADKIIDKVLSSDKAPGNAAPAGAKTPPKK